MEFMDRLSENHILNNRMTPFAGYFFLQDWSSVILLRRIKEQVRKIGGSYVSSICKIRENGLPLPWFSHMAVYLA